MSSKKIGSEVVDSTPTPAQQLLHREVEMLNLSLKNDRQRVKDAQDLIAALETQIAAGESRRDKFVKALTLLKANDV